MAMTGGTAKLVHTGYANYGKSGAINVYVYYKSTQNQDTNKSTVYVGMYVTTPSSTYDIGPWADSAGSYVGTTSNTFDGAIPNFKGTRWIAENKSFTVTHDDSGNAKATIYWKWGVNSPWGQCVNPSGSFTIDLPQIARASTITQTVGTDFGSKAKIKWIPKSTSFYYKVKLSLGSWSYPSNAIYPRTTAEYEYTTAIIPYTAAEQIASNLTGADVTATLYTYSDKACSNQVGVESTDTFWVSIPDNSETKPSMTMSLSPVNDTGKKWSSLYVQGLSKVKASFTGSGKYGATVTNYKMNVEGKDYTSTSSVLSKSGDIVVTGYATDSRGHTQTQKKTIAVIPYEKPSIQHHPDEADIVCARCDNTGKLDDEGTYLRIRAVRSYSKMMSGGTQHNSCLFWYRWKKGDGTYSSWLHALEKSNTTTDIVDLTLSGICTDTTSTYYVQLYVEDDVQTTTPTTCMVPTGAVDFNLKEGGGGAGFGCYADEDKTVKIAEDWELKVIGNRWKSLGISSNVTAPTSSTYFGRAEPGTCSYRVENGNHVYVQISCGFTWSGKEIEASSSAIPSEYRPARDIFGYCASTNKYIVKLTVSSSGKVIVSNVQDMSASTHTDSATISWIDGYIDYFI